MTQDFEPVGQVSFIMEVYGCEACKKNHLEILLRKTKTPFTTSARLHGKLITFQYKDNIVEWR